MIVLTNSDGDADRRASSYSDASGLLTASERVIDPGISS